MMIKLASLDLFKANSIVILFYGCWNWATEPPSEPWLRTRFESKKGQADAAICLFIQSILSQVCNTAKLQIALMEFKNKYWK